MDKQYIGTTVNERLFLSVLLEKYYKAINEKNVVQVIFILLRVGLEEQAIVDILKQNNLYSSSYEI